MISFSFLAILSAILSAISIIIVLSIFKRVYQEEYKRPWLFIGISTIFFASGQIIQFLYDNTTLRIINSMITLTLTYIFNFISVSMLTYGLLLEKLILKYYKGKFVKFKFIPIQEGTLGGELDIDIDFSTSYISINKNLNILFEEFSKAVQKGFEGFLITESNPQEIRERWKIYKTPIAWISQLEENSDSEYIRNSLGYNSGIINPIRLNDLISFVDSFLEQAENSFILMELDSILKSNNFSIIIEFLQYISTKISRYNGTLICTINNSSISASQKMELENILKPLDF